ncbi:helix-turn-helix transcriptional regulator [Streptomyces sp. NPDC050388]|uniref:helix-turn-helix domain-containing protein n=1 Tax=Streptomyces TaxID=1883 RepID=UPI00341684D5
MTAPRATYEVDGSAIRKRRMALGMQIADLARNAGITRSYVSRLETGVRRQVRPPTYKALRTTLGVDTADDQLLAKREPNTE